MRLHWLFCEAALGWRVAKQRLDLLLERLGFSAQNLFQAFLLDPLVLRAVDLPHLCFEEGEDWPMVRECGLAPIVVLTSDLVPVIKGLLQLLASMIRGVEHSVSVAGGPLLLGCVIDVAVFVVLVRWQEVDRRLLETAQQAVFAVDFAKLIGGYEGLNVVLGG